MKNLNSNKKCTKRLWPSNLSPTSTFFSRYKGSYHRENAGAV